MAVRKCKAGSRGTALKPVLWLMLLVMHAVLTAQGQRLGERCDDINKCADPRMECRDSRGGGSVYTCECKSCDGSVCGETNQDQTCPYGFAFKCVKVNETRSNKTCQLPKYRSCSKPHL